MATTPAYKERPKQSVTYSFIRRIALLGEEGEVHFQEVNHLVSRCLSEARDRRVGAESTRSCNKQRAVRSVTASEGTERMERPVEEGEPVEPLEPASAHSTFPHVSSPVRCVVALL